MVFLLLLMIKKTSCTSSVSICLTLFFSVSPCQQTTQPRRGRKHSLYYYNSTGFRRILVKCNMCLCIFSRRTPLCFCLSIPVGPGFTSASPVSHDLSQPGLPARSHPRLFCTWSSETVTTAEVSLY